MLFIYNLFYLNTQAEWWVRDVTTFKGSLNEEIPQGERIVILSGSNCLFGIDSKALSKELNKPVINLSVHAGHNLKYLRYTLEKSIKPNDIVIMPLEFNYYSYQPGFSKWQISNYLAWGRDFISWLPLYDRMVFFLTIEPSYVISMNMNHLLRGIKYRTFKEEKSIFASVKRYNLASTWEFRPHSIKSLNNTGEVTPYVDTLPDLFQKEHKYQIPHKPSDDFIREIKIIDEIVSNNGGHLYLTWPTTIRSGKFNFLDKSTQSAIEDLKYGLEQNNIHIYGNPALYSYDLEYFYDTLYHLNGFGANLRTKSLAHCIKYNILGSNTELGDYVTSYKIVENFKKDCPQPICKMTPRDSADYPHTKLEDPLLYLGLNPSVKMYGLHTGKAKPGKVDDFQSLKAWAEEHYKKYSTPTEREMNFNPEQFLDENPHIKEWGITHNRAIEGDKESLRKWAIHYIRYS